MRVLDVYMHQQFAGKLRQDSSGLLDFTYDRDFLNTAKYPISFSMPLREESFPDKVARPYFSGLLPEESSRKRLAQALGVSEKNSFGLLEVIGGECAGALTLLPEGSELPEFTCGPAELLSDRRLERILGLLRERPLLGGEEGIRLSLAGAQDKIAVCMDEDGQIGLSKDGRPTTHILKPFIEGLDGTVENEIFCMLLASRMGLNAPRVSKGTAGEIDFYIVERYDRIRQSDGDIRKIHQEDFCQALGVPPELKYEEEGGPGIAQSQNLIQKAVRRPAADRLTFQRMVIFHYLIGNADAHSKNYSLLYQDGLPDLAPVYDAICTAVYPRLAKKMAMQLGERSLPDTIQLKHWLAMSLPTRSAQRMLVNDLVQMAEKIGPAADELKRELDDKEVFHPIIKGIRKIIRKRSDLVLRAVENAAKPKVKKAAPKRESKSPAP